MRSLKISQSKGGGPWPNGPPSYIRHCLHGDNAYWNRFWYAQKEATLCIFDWFIFLSSFVLIEFCLGRTSPAKSKIVKWLLSRSVHLLSLVLIGRYPPLHFIPRYKANTLKTSKPALSKATNNNNNNNNFCIHFLCIKWWNNTVFRVLERLCTRWRSFGSLYCNLFCFDPWSVFCLLRSSVHLTIVLYL